MKKVVNQEQLSYYEDGVRYCSALNQIYFALQKENSFIAPFKNYQSFQTELQSVLRTIEEILTSPGDYPFCDDLFIKISSEYLSFSLTQNFRPRKDTDSETKLMVYLIPRDFQSIYMFEKVGFSKDQIPVYFAKVYQQKQGKAVHQEFVVRDQECLDALKYLLDPNKIMTTNVEQVMKLLKQKKGF